MLLNYLKIALRNLYKRKFYTAINLFGLSIGLTAAAIVILYLRHEYSYDKAYTLADRTWRISGKKQGVWFAPLSTSYSDALYRKSFPEVETTARVRRWPPKFITWQEKKLFEPAVLFTDPGSAFFSVFDLPFSKGSAQEALQQPGSMVITETIARQLFGNEDPIGKAVVYDTMAVTVTGVIKDLPQNTHLAFNVLVTDANAMKIASGLFTYCVLAKDADIKALEKKLIQLPRPEKDFQPTEEIAVLPLTSLHFNANMTFELKPAGSELYLLLFSLIGLFIVFLSCTNYMNLSVALYAGRKKEIAVRKVSGARNAGLALQFLTEAVCLCLFCIPVTLLLLQVALPLFNQYMQVQLHNEFISSFSGIGLLLGITLLTGIVSGSYPAWVLPKLKATALFKKGTIASKSGLSLRQALVTIQVTILVLIMSAGWIIKDQLSYMQQKDLGFNKEGVLKLTGAWMLDSSQYYTIKNELLRNPLIKSVSQGLAPGDENYGMAFKAPGSATEYSDLMSFGTDYDYLATLGLKLKEADFTSIQQEKPRRLILVNETLAKRLGYTDAVGKQIVLYPGKKNERIYTINGVVKDFHFYSLHQPMSPVLFNIRSFGSGVSENVLVNVQTQQLPATLDYIRKTTAAVAPGLPLAPKFLDESLQKYYEKEQKLSLLSGVLLAVTLFLAVIGLLGLAAYMATLRTKEIGIRKVLGASVPGVILLLCKDFLKQLGIAALIASPLAWWAAHQWLQGFAYRVNIRASVFVVTISLAVAIVLVTISVQVIKAALANPVKSLRSE